jgi:geranylgeranyl reductase family protein
MPHYDVIVIGAGPSGCTAAHDLAKAGASVALIEKQTLPRHKTCGGGMPYATRQLLDLDIAADLPAETFLECDTRFMRHTFGFDEAALMPMNPPNEKGETGNLSLWMVQRSVFDNALAQRAAQNGADLREGLAVRSIERETGKPIQVHAEGKGGAWEATCNFVVGADGANGVTAKQIGLRKERALAIAIEVEVPHVWGTGHETLRPDILHLEFGAVPKGYAWVFPKGDHLNVGAGVFRPKGDTGRHDSSVKEELHRAIHAYMELLDVPNRRSEHVYHAHPLPIWNGMDTIQTRDNRVLLVGDSAGLINPFFGDGIFHALKSGQIAAQSILSNETAQYSKHIAAEFKANFDAALKLAKLFYQFPGFCYRHGVVRPTATQTATKLICGDLRFDQIAGKVLKRLRGAMLKEAKN